MALWPKPASCGKMNHIQWVRQRFNGGRTDLKRAKPMTSAALAISHCALRNKGPTMEYPPKSRLRHDVVTFNCPHCQGFSKKETPRWEPIAPLRILSQLPYFWALRLSPAALPKPKH